jgi:hypothetical protein
MKTTPQCDGEGGCGSFCPGRTHDIVETTSKGASMNVKTTHTIELHAPGGHMAITGSVGKDNIQVKLEESGDHHQAGRSIVLSVRRYDWKVFARKLDELLPLDEDDPRG